MKSKEQNKKRSKILILVGICVLVVVALFFILRNNSKNDFPGKGDFPKMNGEMPGEMSGHMQDSTEDEILEVNNFFSLSPSDSEIESYCQENRNLCMYYCIQNQESSYCTNLMSSMDDRTPPDGMGDFPRE